MKLKLILSLIAAGTLATSAQGFKDGLEYFRAGEPSDARIILNNTLSDPTTDVATAKYYLGQIALGEKDFNTAKKLFEEGLLSDPKNGFNYVGLGQLALLQGNPSVASDHFKQARALGKKDAVLITDIARAYFNADPVKYTKEIQKTIADAKKADKTCPAIYILEADMLENPGEAAGYYEMAMSFDPQINYPEAYIKYGRTYFRVSPKFAIDKIKELNQKLPTSALAQRELAEKYYDDNQLTRAAEQYGKYMSNPNHFQKDEQRYVGLLFFGKKYDESLALARNILAKDPENIFMQRMVMYNLAELGQKEEAAQAGAKLMSMAGEHTPKDYTTYGDILFQLQRPEEAVAQYEKAVEILPEKVSLLQSLSDAYTDAGMYDKAVTAMEQYIEKNPEHTVNDLVILGRRYMNAAAMIKDNPELIAQYVERGTKVLDEVNERVPNNYQVLITKLRLLSNGNNQTFTANDITLAKELLGILDSDPENISRRANDYQFILYGLGKYYLGEKDNANAAIYFERVADQFRPDDTQLRTLVDTLKK